jgi:hypothetical protein
MHELSNLANSIFPWQLPRVRNNFALQPKGVISFTLNHRYHQWTPAVGGLFVTIDNGPLLPHSPSQSFGRLAREHPVMRRHFTGLVIARRETMKQWQILPREIEGIRWLLSKSPVGRQKVLTSPDASV